MHLLQTAVLHFLQNSSQVNNWCRAQLMTLGIWFLYWNLTMSCFVTVSEDACSPVHRLHKLFVHVLQYNFGSVLSQMSHLITSCASSSSSVSPQVAVVDRVSSSHGSEISSESSESQEAIGRQWNNIISYAPLILITVDMV